MLLLRTFGGLSLLRDSQPVTGAGAQPRRLLLLAALADAGPRGATRDALLALLWPARGAASGRQALSQALYALRRDSARDDLVAGLGTERLSLNPTAITSDVEQFVRAVDEARHADAVALHAGPFLHGVHVDDQDGTIADWIDGVRARTDGQVRAALEALAARAEHDGDPATALRWWSRRAALDPLDDGPVLGQMRALVGRGDRAAALQMVERHARHLASALSVAPSPAVTALARELRRSTALGRISCLPAVVSSVIGRDTEAASLRALLDSRAVRLVTVTGAGGSGKTTLALRAAGATTQFEARVFVDLSPLREPRDVPAAIAAALDAGRHGDDAAIEAAAEAIGTNRVLVLLDNMEQVVDAGVHVARLLSLAPALTVLVTSRARLRVRGEHEFSLSPLSLPEPDAPTADLARSPAVALFVARAQELAPAFAPDTGELRDIARICIALDGLPLAIELAAARVRLLPPGTLRQRLTHERLDLLADGPCDLPARQRTLRATLAWSYDLLPAPQRAALHALALFLRPCSVDTLADALAVPLTTAVARAEAIVDASLARARPDGRLELLETVRAFALEQLQADTGAAARLRDAHAAAAVRLARDLGQSLEGPAPHQALAQFTDALPDLRAALTHASSCDPPAVEDAMPVMCEALWRGWLRTGHWSEGRAWLAAALARPAMAPRRRAGLLGGMAAIAQNQGDYREAYASAAEALDTWTALDDPRGVDAARLALAWIAWRRGGLREAGRLASATVRRARTRGDVRIEAQAWHLQGWVSMFAGRYATAEAHLRASLALRLNIGDPRDIAFTQASLALTLGRDGRGDEAAPALAGATWQFEALGDRQLWSFATLIQAELALLAGDVRTTLDTLDTCEPVFGVLGDRWAVASALALRGDAEFARDRTDAAAAAYEDSGRLALDLDDRYQLAVLEGRRALVSIAEGRAVRASRQASTAARMLAGLDACCPPWLEARLAGAGLAS